MNMSVKNNMLHLFCQTNYDKGSTHAFQIFFLNFCKIAYIICNPIFEINKPKSQPKTAV